MKAQIKYGLLIIILFTIAFSFQVIGANAVSSDFSKKEKEELNRMLAFDLFFNFELTKKNDNLSIIGKYIPYFKEDNVKSVKITSNLGGQSENIDLIYDSKGQLVKLDYLVGRLDNEPLLFRYNLVYKKKLLQFIKLKGKNKYGFIYKNGLLRKVLIYRNGVVTFIYNFEYDKSQARVTYRLDVTELGKIDRGSDFHKKDIYWNETYRMINFEISRYHHKEINYDKKGNILSYRFNNAISDWDWLSWNYTFDKNENWIAANSSGDIVVKRTIKYNSK